MQEKHRKTSIYEENLKTFSVINENHAKSNGMQQIKPISANKNPLLRAHCNAKEDQIKIYDLVGYIFGLCYFFTISTVSAYGIFS